MQLDRYTTSPGHGTTGGKDWTTSRSNGTTGGDNRTTSPRPPPCGGYSLNAEEAAAHRPRVVHVDGKNRIVDLTREERNPPTRSAAAE